MKKINVQRFFGKILLLGIFAFLVGCAEDADNNFNTSVTGVWYYAAYASPKGKYLDQLTLNSDSTFKYEQKSFGIYSGQDKQDTSTMYIRDGKYLINADSISFITFKIIRWDSFTQLRDTSTQCSTLFQNCTFSIHGYGMSLKYTTYPADAPEITTKNFYKLTF